MQSQSTMEAPWQKWYYDRKIGAVNLKPGDLVLVKADAWKEKRKIKDRWEEETREVVHQIMADIPSYKVMNQHGWSRVLHQNWLLLIMSEVGIPLCMGSCHTWDRCTSPTPCKTTSVRGGEMRMPQEKDGKAVTWWPTCKASLGWKTGCSLYHGHLLEHPLRMGEDHWKSDLAADLRRNTYIRQRDDIYAHWCWWIVNQKRNATTHWTGSQQARPNRNIGGSETGK